VRRGPTHWHKLGAGNAKNKGPLHRVHVDQSYRGAELVLREHLPEESENLLQHRWQIVNLWRPISTVFKDPLAVAAAHSIAESDLVPAALIYTSQPPRSHETWTILPNEKHEWFYKNEQRPDEVLLIKCFDSLANSGKGFARRAPHCAFKDPEREGEEWAHRQSIEIRALLFYDE